MSIASSQCPASPLIRPALPGPFSRRREKGPGSPTPPPGRASDCWDASSNWRSRAGSAVPVRGSTPSVICTKVIAILDRTGDDAQVAADAFLVLHDELRTPSTLLVIAWCDVSSQTMWQRPHLMQRS